MATKKTSSKKPALKLVTETKTKVAAPALRPCDSTLAQLYKMDKDKIIQEVLNAITVGDCSDEPPTNSAGSDASFHINNHFAYGASQINADLAVAAQCEMEGDFRAEGDQFLSFFASTEMEKLRRTFLDDVKGRLREKTEARYQSNVTDPLKNFAVRMYYAGLLSPDRREPCSDYERRQRHIHRAKWEEENAKRMAAK